MTNWAKPKPSLDAQAAYVELRQLAAAIPQDLTGNGRISVESMQWLGRAGALIQAQAEADGDAQTIYDSVAFNGATNGLTGVLREQYAHEIVAILFRAVARAERAAPAAAKNTFIGVGAEFSALQAVGAVLREAKRSVLFLDAYLDATVLTDFAALAPERVAIQIFTDPATGKLGSLRPAVTRWQAQYGTLRPLEAKLSPPRALHDRLLLIDGGAQVWNLSQSLNHLAGRSPASLTRFDDEVARMKVDYYMPLWTAGGAL